MTTPKLAKDDVEEAFSADAEYLGGGTFGDTWCIDGYAEKILCGAQVDAARFGREVEALGRLSHDRVVKLHEVREIEIGGTKYRVMRFDYVAGGDAAKRIQIGDLVSLEEVRPLLVGLLEGAEAMHASKVVHRDIKPANIILRGGSWADPVLCDLGLARLDDETSITQYPARVGSVPYMAPEQLAKERAVKASDMWAIGIVVREAIAGRHPFLNPGEQPTPDGFAAGPIDLPEDLDEDIAGVLDALNSVQQHWRSTATNNLGRLNTLEDTT